MSGSVEHELRTHSEALRKLARLLVGAQEADDLVQDIAMQALHRPPEQPAGLRRWLLAVLRHRASKHRRSEQRRQRRERGAPLPDPEATPLRIAEHKETLARLHGALLALPEPYLGTLLLRFFEDLTPSQIADHTAVPLATVKSRLQRGLGLLRERLDAEPGDWRSSLATAFGFGDVLKVGAGAAALGTGVIMASGFKLACAGVVAVLAIAAWLWSGGVTERSGPAGVGPGSDKVAAVSGNATDAGQSAIANATNAGGARSEIELPADEPRPGYVRVRVVRAEDHAPLPGAEVWFLDPLYRSLVERNTQQEIDSQGDLFTTLMRQGRHTTANVAGGVDVPMLWMGGPRVAAVSGERAGCAELSSFYQENGYELPLAVRRFLRVIVVQADGSPASGAPVAAFLKRAGDDLMRTLGTTDASGCLALHGVATLKAWSGNWSLGIAAPGLQSLRAPFDPAEPPPEPVRLVLPPTGTVHMIVQDGLGRTLRGDDEIGIHRLMEDGKQGPLCRSIATDPAGRATVPFVGLGERLRARSERIKLGVDFTGPVHAGETVTAILVPADDVVLIRGRLLTQEGQLAGGMRLALQGEATLSDHKLGLSASSGTDEEGQFCLAFDGAVGASELHGRLTVLGTRRRVDARFAEFRIATQPGTMRHEVGTLQLQSPDIVMSGRVVLADGTPVDRAELEPVVTPRAGTGELQLHVPAPARIQVDEDGGFALLASDQPPPAALRVTARGCLPARVEVVAGARDVRVVLDRACGLTVEVRVPAAFGKNQLPVRVELSGHTPINMMGRHGDSLFGEWDRLTPGSYHLALWLHGGTEPLVERTVALESSGRGRMRREVIDLGNCLRTAMVTLVDVEGEPVRPDGILLTAGGGEFEGRRVVDAFEVRGGKARVVTSEAAMAFEVVVRGYVPQRFTGPVQDVELRLQPMPEVSVQVSGLDEVPPACRVRLTATDGERVGFFVRCEMQMGMGPGMLTVFRSELVKGAGRLALCRACRLQCALSLGQGESTQDVRLPEVMWIPGQDKIDISVDPAELRAALGRLR